ncbi:hypothetical protein C8E17_0266 [Serratia plymuthica]|uniref:Uncharacterized protein n=1 Tax=Serratia plymuthica TaxID=82996 RepID=A0A2X4VDN5_SERPL|nr:hypothetical protein C8E17_0266 [Serratia plymuthica]CAI1527645.1 Uncharacterised protein [Serratia plymuthica]CAI2474966.1 Uncharacterised protein [Serratia plymuthica]SQI43380.1 Uncharacterised protein [Serratia plymuthica]
MRFTWSGDIPLVLPETYPFEKKIIIDVMLPRQFGDAAAAFERLRNEFKFEVRGIMFAGFSGSHEVST